MNVFKNCLWIGGSDNSQSPVIIKRFSVEEDNMPATLTVTGLGYFEAKINGINVTDYKFIPVVSDYEPRDLSKLAYPLKDKTTNRIYYYEFDVSNLISVGENTLTIQLGNGFYRQTVRMNEGDCSFGNCLKTAFKLKIGDTEIYSDGSEGYCDSRIVKNNLFHGEEWEMGEAAEEKKVSILPCPEAEISPAIGTPDKVISLITPTKISDNIYDTGENITGIVRVTSSAKKGEKITLTFAENINADCTLNYESADARQIQRDSFVCSGKTEVFEPKFVWHGFRYFEINGDYDKLEVLIIHADTAVTSEFESDSEGLNYLYKAYLRTQLNNMHGSIPSDCPHRERLGYTGDGQVCAPAAMLMLDCREFYEKWIQDILDCQDKLSGHVQHTAPLMGGGGGPGGWGGAMVFVPYDYYVHYGDKELIKRCYPHMKHWIEYLETKLNNGLITHEEEGGWCLGDWASIGGVKIPSEFVNSCLYIKQLGIMEELSGVLGYTDSEYYAKLKATVTDAVNCNFKKGNSYAEGVQGADAFALWCGIADEKTAEILNTRYDELGYFDTGFIGTDILVDVLFSKGYKKTAMKLLENDQIGSFLYMKRQGSTTLWEYLNGDNSHDHPMFGACTRQIFTSVLGIKQQEGSVGFEKIVIDPIIPEHMQYAKGSIMTPKGKIYVSWDKFDGYIKLEVKIPDGVEVQYGYQKIAKA